MHIYLNKYVLNQVNWFKFIYLKYITFMYNGLFNFKKEYFVI